MLLIKHNSSDSGFRLHPSLRKHQCYDTKLNSSCKNTEEAGSGARMGLYAIQSSSRSKGKQFLIVFKKFFAVVLTETALTLSCAYKTNQRVNQ